jgi:hypothetical protein
MARPISREVDRPLVPLVQLQPVGEVRGDLGNDPALGLGEPDREALLRTGHCHRPSYVKHGATSPSGRESRRGRSHRSGGGDTP